jgi:uncharacterized protein YndB with AHSA1/START domain
MNLSNVLERTLSPTLRPASVRLSRQVSAGPERIFDAWLDADEARRFLFAGRIGDAVRSEIDARVGGGFRIVRHRGGDAIEYSGEYLEIDRPHRLVFSLFVEKYAQRDDRVIVEFAPVAQQSLLVLTHELSLPDPAERSRIQHAWAMVLDRLGRLCAESRVPSVVAPALGSGARQQGIRAVHWLSAATERGSAGGREQRGNCDGVRQMPRSCADPQVVD